mmetsp:Transcript_57571/g.150003  ORF Transcript_57571/g.150003 Transcript_57571/m.150003 type:complete len:102 (-) Transcript_57571:294-599(-)
MSEKLANVLVSEFECFSALLDCPVAPGEKLPADVAGPPNLDNKASDEMFGCGDKPKHSAFVGFGPLRSVSEEVRCIDGGVKLFWIGMLEEMCGWYAPGGPF